MESRFNRSVGADPAGLAAGGPPPPRPDMEDLVIVILKSSPFRFFVATVRDSKSRFSHPEHAKSTWKPLCAIPHHLPHRHFYFPIPHSLIHTISNHRNVTFKPQTKKLPPSPLSSSRPLTPAIGPDGAAMVRHMGDNLLFVVSNIDGKRNRCHIGMDGSRRE